MYVKQPCRHDTPLSQSNIYLRHSASFIGHAHICFTASKARLAPPYIFITPHTPCPLCRTASLNLQNIDTTATLSHTSFHSVVVRRISPYYFLSYFSFVMASATAFSLIRTSLFFLIFFVLSSPHLHITVLQKIHSIYLYLPLLLLAVYHPCITVIKILPLFHLNGVYYNH